MVREVGLNQGFSQRTFSRPKNLSLPSSCMGPAFWSIFSRGVNSAGGSSFFAWAAAAAACIVSLRQLWPGAKGMWAKEYSQQRAFLGAVAELLTMTYRVGLPFEEAGHGYGALLQLLNRRWYASPQ